MKSCVYFIKEKVKKFTPKKDKLNILYIGETKDFEMRKLNYTHPSYTNEIYNKLQSYLFVKRKDTPEIESFIQNIEFRTFSFSRLENNGYRKEVEGYLINKFSPLLNKAKKNAVFSRSYKEFKKNNKYRDSNEFSFYMGVCNNCFNSWYFDRSDIHGTEWIVNPKTRQPVKRNSYEGQKIVSRNRDKKFKTWFQKNELYHKFDSFRTNREQWLKNIKWR